jgi:hypothetical protein
MRFKLDLAAQVRGHFFEGCNEVVADTGAGTSTRFDARPRLTPACSF